MSLMIFLGMNMAMMSIIFTNLSQPLTMGMILLLQTFLVAIFSGTLMTTYWFSYILMLIFLGAMLILFIYVCSLASNQEFKLSPSIFASALVFILLSTMFFFLDPMFVNSSYMKMSSFSKISLMLSPEWMLSMIYSNQGYLITLLIILYLLLTLVVVVKIVNSYFGPLRLSN